VMSTGSSAFAFRMEDLRYWVTRRRDGIIVKHVLKDGAIPTSQVQSPVVARYPTYSGYTQPKLSDWCKHDPKQPLWTSEEMGSINPAEPRFMLYIGDAAGARGYRKEFDYIIDGGDVISPTMMGEPILSGDADLSAELEIYSLVVPGPRVLKIDWEDRKDPPLHPEFWVELAKRLSGRVLVCCQGGHGRSGSSAVALMMVLSPDYSARDAIVHLRALHCPRAIESKLQHQYLNEVAEYLGRKQDALEVEEIKDYREEFRALATRSATAKRFLAQLEEKK
jgi:hypothetical protein